MGYAIRDFAGEEAGQVRAARCQLRGQTVKIDAEAQHARSVVCAKLCNKRREDPGKDVARAALRQAGIAGRTDEGLPVRGSHDCVIALEDKVRVPAPCCIKCHCEAVCLNGQSRDSEKPAHFTGMRRKSQKFRLAVAKKVATAGKGVQTICIQNRGQGCLANDGTNEFLRFGVRAKTRTDAKNGLALQDFFEAISFEAAESNRAFVSRLQTLRHVFRLTCGNVRQYNVGCSYRDQPCAGPQRAPTRENSGAALPERTCDEEDMPESAFVGFDGANQRQLIKFIRPSPAKLLLSNFFNQRGGRANRANIQSTDCVCIPRKELADLGRRKSDRRVCP